MRRLSIFARSRMRRHEFPKLESEPAGHGRSAGWCRYLRGTDKGKAFEIDADKLAEMAHLDGIFVPRTHTPS